MSGEERRKLNTLQNQNKRRTFFKHWHLVMAYLVIYDAAAVTLAYFLALLFRFDFQLSMIPQVYLKSWEAFAPLYALLCIPVFWRLRLYRSIWRFASFKELERITLASIITTLLHIVGMFVAFQIIGQAYGFDVDRMPLSYYLTGAMLQFVFITGIRFSYRFILLLRAARSQTSIGRVLIVGAGSAGQMLQKDVRRTRELNSQIVCFIDDNQNKWGRDIDGTPVVGGRDVIMETVREMDIDKIYIALPSVSAKERKKIIDICRQTDCEVMNLPGMYQLALGDVTVSSLKKVDVEDLLGREPVKMNSREVRDYLNGKVVLVTGAGGSIGSEICRQVAKAPGLRQLIIFDIYENNAHAIKLELADEYPELDVVTLIGSVRNSRKINRVFQEYRPDIVFHAAAHKHVPLMEDSPCEAIKNNVMGTYHVAFAAMAFECEKFVLISTDKAVNPVNIMGNGLILGTT